MMLFNIIIRVGSRLEIHPKMSQTHGFGRAKYVACTENEVACKQLAGCLQGACKVLARPVLCCLECSQHKPVLTWQLWGRPAALTWLVWGVVPPCTADFIFFLHKAHPQWNSDGMSIAKTLAAKLA